MKGYLTIRSVRVVRRWEHRYPRKVNKMIIKDKNSYEKSRDVLKIISLTGIRINRK